MIAFNRPTRLNQEPLNFIPIANNINYKPSINVNSFSSNGVVSRISGRKAKRIHHLMSKLELSFFLLMEWNLNVIDIQEQFPLDPKITTKIASDAGIYHPKCQHTKKPHVMNTDFIIFIKRGISDIKEAYSIKTLSDLSKKRTREKLEIERRYWKYQYSINYKVFTEKQINTQKIQNIKWCHQYIGDKKKNKCLSILEDIEPAIKLYPYTKISDYGSCIDLEDGLPNGTTLEGIRILISNQILIVSIDIKWPDEILLKNILINKEDIVL